VGFAIQLGNAVVIRHARLKLGFLEPLSDGIKGW